MSSCVEPGKSAPERFDFQVVLGKVVLIDGCYFQLSPCAGLDVFGYVDHAIGVEVESHHGIVALRVFWLFFYAEAVPVFVELCHAVSLGVVDVIAENRRIAVDFGFLDAFS